MARRKAKKKPAKPNKKKAATSPPRGSGLVWAVRWLAYWTIIAAIWAGIGGGVVVAYYAYDLPAIDDLAQGGRTPGVTILAADGSVLASYGQVFAGPVGRQDLPQALIDAIVSIEDRRFYDHFGIDPWGILRAAVTNLRAGRLLQGGSTITQQIAKNVFLTPARTLRRKVQEVLLAFWLEHRFAKDQLLTIYLNRVYLGSGSYGVEAAARRYFGKTTAALGLAEAAMLAGLPKAPSRYAPTHDLAAAQARAAVVLDAMVAAGRLDGEAAAAAKAAPATLAGSYRGSGSARYFADWISDRLADYIGRPAEDMVVVTTLRPSAQIAAERAVAALLGDVGAAKNVGQAALVAMSPDGAVRAMVGGRSYAASQFNRAVQARRQPGSAFKIAVYAAALEAGLAADDKVDDAPIDIDGWQPRNYGGTYRGSITLTEALAHSSNSVAVQLTERVGRGVVLDTARRLGIGGALAATPSVALGVGEVSLIDLTGAYAVVANGGTGVLPHGIAEIRGRDDRVVYRREGSGLGRVLPAAVAETLSMMLHAAVTTGTGRRAALDVPTAGKTGTSQDFRDAWFLGYRAGLVAGVWLGNDDATPMDGVTGGSLPAHLWRDFMNRYPP